MLTEICLPTLQPTPSAPATPDKLIFRTTGSPQECNAKRFVPRLAADEEGAPDAAEVSDSTSAISSAWLLTSVVEPGSSEAAESSGLSRKGERGMPEFLPDSGSGGDGQSGFEELAVAATGSGRAGLTSRDEGPALARVPMLLSERLSNPSKFCSSFMDRLYPASEASDACGGPCSTSPPASSGRAMLGSSPTASRCWWPAACAALERLPKDCLRARASSPPPPSSRNRRMAVGTKATIMPSRITCCMITRSQSSSVQ